MRASLPTWKPCPPPCRRTSKLWTSASSSVPPGFRRRCIADFAEHLHGGKGSADHQLPADAGALGSVRQHLGRLACHRRRQVTDGLHPLAAVQVFHEVGKDLRRNPGGTEPDADVHSFDVRRHGGGQGFHVGGEAGVRLRGLRVPDAVWPGHCRSGICRGFPIPRWQGFRKICPWSRNSV